MNKIFKTNVASLSSYSPRTRFDLSHHHLTSTNVGLLTPIICLECLPGDTHTLDLHSLVRMQTPIAPIMDDIYGDYYFFFVPYRLLDDNFEKVITISDWTGSNEEELDTFKFAYSSAVGTISRKHLGSYLSLPIGTYSYGQFSNIISTAPFRAYTMIWNDYFRDENYQSPVTFSNIISTGSVSVDPVDDWLNGTCNFGSSLAPVNEKHDLFTSVLPEPQKGNQVLLPLGDTAPVFINATATAGTLITPRAIGVGIDTKRPLSSYTTGTGTSPVDGDTFVDLSAATASTINQLREAIVMQHFLETLARTGSRYTEYLKGFWGVNAPDSRLQRPEFIAEWHTRINVSEVVQTSGLDEASGTTLGSTGAVSRTGTSKNGLFTYSCVEHGFLMGFFVVRHKLSYSQGISNMWLRKKGIDFYHPVFNGLGEVGIKTVNVLAPVGYHADLQKEVYNGAGSSVDFNSLLGFNESWAEYKFFTNRTSGLLNPVAKEGLDYWTLTKTFTEGSISGADIRVADDKTLDRALSIPGQDQFICDFFFDLKATRRMPLRSIPGVDRI